MNKKMNIMMNNKKIIAGIMSQAKLKRIIKMKKKIGIKIDNKEEVIGEEEEEKEEEEEEREEEIEEEAEVAAGLNNLEIERTEMMEEKIEEIEEIEVAIEKKEVIDRIFIY